jgi:Holliday junction DNA helicase RuvB
MGWLFNRINSIVDIATEILDPQTHTLRDQNKVNHLVNTATISVYPHTEIIQDDIFAEIYGHEDIKNIVNMALKSVKPVHTLLVSPPGMAKTHILLAIRSMFKNESCFVIGSSSTKKGIIDLLFDKRPQILLIDELETMSYDTQESLLNLMETGILSETKKTYRREIKLENIKVFATSNDTKHMLSPLLSRFIVLNIPPYTDQQFIEIAVQRLTSEEGISEELATEIAKQVVLKLNRKDLRDCIKVARIVRTPEDVESVINIMK